MGHSTDEAHGRRQLLAHIQHRSCTLARSRDGGCSATSTDTVSRHGTAQLCSYAADSGTDRATGDSYQPSHRDTAHCTRPAPPLSLVSVPQQALLLLALASLVTRGDRCRARLSFSSVHSLSLSHSIYLSLSVPHPIASLAPLASVPHPRLSLHTSLSLSLSFHLSAIPACLPASPSPLPALAAAASCCRCCLPRCVGQSATYTYWNTTSCNGTVLSSGSIHGSVWQLVSVRVCLLRTFRTAGCGLCAGDVQCGVCGHHRHVLGRRLCECGWWAAVDRDGDVWRGHVCGTAAGQRHGHVLQCSQQERSSSTRAVIGGMAGLACGDGRRAGDERAAVVRKRRQVAVRARLGAQWLGAEVSAMPTVI